MEQRRRRDRRRGKDRRQGGGPAAEAVERRLGRELEGRRFGERRAVLVPVDEQPALPPDLYGYADQLGFVRRVDGSRLDLDVARLKEMAAQWRDRCRDAEREATGLLRTLVGVADDLGRLRTWSPRRFMAVHRVQRTIERYHQGHPEGAPPSDRSVPPLGRHRRPRTRRGACRPARHGTGRPRLRGAGADVLPWPATRRRARHAARERPGPRRPPSPRRQSGARPDIGPRRWSRSRRGWNGHAAGPGGRERTRPPPQYPSVHDAFTQLRPRRAPRRPALPRPPPAQRPAPPAEGP